jgi:hypothetical protein
MAAEHTDTRFPSPWNEFLHELDGMLTDKQLEVFELSWRHVG